MIKVGEHGWLEKDAPVAGPLDAIVRPIAVAPCSSDTHVMHGGAGPFENRILGHEAVGIVEEVGELVTNIKPGDKVAINCVTPDWNVQNVQRKGSNPSHDVGLMGSFKFVLSEDGVFAELFKVNNADANLVVLPEGVSVKSALMAADMMPTGFYAAEQANIQLGDTVVVFGIGPVGLMAVAGARLLGAGRIYAIGTRKNCAELALEYGATEIISYKDGNTVEQILEKEGGQVDSVIIAGSNASAINEALALVKPNGTISSVNFYDITEKFEIPLIEWGLGMSDVTLKTGFCPGGGMRMEKMLNLIQAGRVDPSKLINYEFEGFDKIPDAFIMMDEKPRDLIKPAVFFDTIE